VCEIFCIFGKFCLQLNQVIHDSLLEFDLSLTANDAKKLKEIEFILNLNFHHNASVASNISSEVNKLFSYIVAL
jgi:hypothetical protein